MKRYLLVLALCFICFRPIRAQSLEIMPGTERIFVDAQWLKTFDDQRRWSLFSRSRATVDYEQNTNLFTGAYFNYTTTSGFGGSVLGRISHSSAGGDVGIHFFKARSHFMVYALASVGVQSNPPYSWFSIVRFTPQLNATWKLYSSLELFSSFDKEAHRASVQRIRLGVDRKGYQWGLALNLSGIGANYQSTDTNPGIFIRKQF